MPTDEQLTAMSTAERTAVLDKWDAEETRQARVERDAETAKEYGS